MGFLKDKRVRFAIGLAVVLLAIKWLFSDSLLFAMSTIEEGNTGSATTAFLPLVLDFFIGALVAIGAWVIDAGSFLVGRFSPSSQPAAALSTDADSMRSNVISLGNAVASNDIDAIEPLMTLIRQPFAIRELSEAYTSGKMEEAERLSAELKKMHGAGSAPTQPKRGAK